MTSPRSPHTYKSKRHILSSDSSSPQQDGKKIKSFISPNCYAVLAKVDGDTETELFHPNYNVVGCEQLPQTEVAPKPTRIPAIYVKNITNFSMFNK